MSDYWLLLGARHFKDKTKSPGGVVTLFEDFIDRASENNINFKIIDLNKRNYSNLFVAYISILFNALKKIPNSNFVFLHGASNDYLFIAPIILIISKLFKKKFALRKFAGNFDLIYKNSNFIKKTIIRFVVKNSDAAFWETKRLVEFWKQFNARSYWFPNVRIKNELTRDLNKPFEKKFIYLGQISKEKGVHILLNAKSYLDETYNISFYGQIKEPLSINDFDNKICFYKGFVSANQVPFILSQFDVLLLPSGREEEGYPGVIIEAYMSGVPAIATKIGGIPEIVKDLETGLLAISGNEIDFFNKIKMIDEDLHSILRKNAYDYSQNFDSTIVFLQIKKIISNILL